MSSARPAGRPRTITHIAAQREFRRPGTGARRVILTIGVPERVPGSDWGCAVQITGLGPFLARPRVVFGVDALQALQLAMQFATVNLETSGYELEWLGHGDDLGLPRFLPELPKPQQRRLDRMIEREVKRLYAAATRRTAGQKRRGR